MSRLAARRHQAAVLGRRVARRAARTGIGRRIRPPHISVIVPFYNVESYIAECLDSIVAQDFTDFEVLLVDDGSPDGSRAIAEQYAARDPRFRIVTRENGGLGAARNTGVRAARGRFLTFVDSDDSLTPWALRRLHETAVRTGSDIVVGAVDRFNIAKDWWPTWVPEVHDDLRQRVTIAEYPALLRNLYTWNKLFRRNFWDAQDLWFREGVAYEDQPIVTQLFARAAAIDVIPDHVYRYRARDDLSSISQQTASIKDLRDRIAAWHVSREVLTKELTPELYDEWRLTLFQVHFHWYLTSGGTVDDDYWAELVAAIRELAEGAPDWVWEQTLPNRRLLVQLAIQDRREDLQELVRRKVQNLPPWPSRLREDGVLLELPLLGDPALPDELFVIHPDQLQLWHHVENFHWETDPDGEVVARITGRAFLGKVDLATHEQRVAVVLRDDQTGEEHVCWSTETPESSFEPPTEDAWCDYNPGLFGVRVPIGRLAAAARQGSSWTVHLRIEVGDMSVTRPMQRMLRSGAAGLVPAVLLRGGGRLLTEWQVNRVLRLSVDRTAAVVRDVALEDRTLRGTVVDTAGVAAIVLNDGGDRAVAPVGGDGSFQITLPRVATPKPGHAVEWRLLAQRTSGGRSDIVPTDDTYAYPAGVALAVDVRRDFALIVREFGAAVRVDSAEVGEDGVLRIVGRVVGRPATRLRIRARSKRSLAVGEFFPVTDGRFTAELELRHEVYRFGRWPLPLGDHDISADLTVAKGDVVRVPMQVSRKLNEQLPAPVHTSRIEGRVVRGPESMVRISILRPIGDGRGNYRQNRLRSAPRRTTLTRGLLLRSYFGELATDNGLSIQRELQRRGSDLPVYWAVHDHSVVVPEGSIPVVVNSPEWYELMQSASYYVDNMYQPEWHQKPEGQVLVQTFHGYPFKQMGHTHWRNVQFSQARIDSYDERARQWDHLISPARYATPLLRRDFAYDGNVLEIGYPRNDVLQSPLAGPIREATRSALGIEPHQKAVLYAPTFRDYLSVDDNSAWWPDFLDFERAASALGPDYVILIRGHAFNARTEHRLASLSGCIDVTDYPEISDLYLAADAAVVDYSSLRFDFGVTGKPMVFQVPDLQRYKDTRGWLFDFEPTAPGPLVSTTDDVVDHLRDLDRLGSEHASAYEKFRADYLDLEDGRAGARFVDAVMVPRGDAPPDPEKENR
ncbi:MULTISPECIES: bifunctional glycosyltransferase/CDP-glycerol:glycerophosphate glycerophosphotransferase [unclassified Nocardioides]|uniref:bifunctional glycosyltransferase/CDP-glycerol:glycerophosphate glycerophosphotransferase n=1 Tax=unclassified Nocardioides TaxID=2615069 RepID=UPI00360E8DE1